MVGGGCMDESSTIGGWATALGYDFGIPGND